MRKLREKPLVRDTRARHAVLALLDHETQEALAARADLAQSQISLIVIRDRLAGRKTAGKLKTVGIAIEWWDEPPTSAQLKADRQRRRAA